MDKEEYEKLSESFFDTLCSSECIPNSLISLETFKARKKQELEEEGEKLFDNAFKGIIKKSIIFIHVAWKHLNTRQSIFL